ncbi:unnamed protein product [Agarophyton chilense]
MPNPVRAVRRGLVRLALRHGPQRHVLVPLYYIASPPRNPHPLPDLRTAQRRLLQLTNHLRRRHSLHTVQLSSSLSHIAQRHSQYQGSKAKATHKGRHGFHLSQRLKEANFEFRYAGENVASGQRTVDDVFHSWYRSKGHRPPKTAIGVNSKLKSLRVPVLSPPAVEEAARSLNAAAQLSAMNLRQPNWYIADLPTDCIPVPNPLGYEFRTSQLILNTIAASLPWQS